MQTILEKALRYFPGQRDVKVRGRRVKNRRVHTDFFWNAPHAEPHVAHDRAAATPCAAKEFK